MTPLFPSEPPPDLPPELRWRCIKVPPGMHRAYMVAGPGWSGTVHYTGKRTWPCAKALTAGRMPCPLCRFKPRFGCYLPVFALNGEKQPQLVIQGAKRTLETWSGFKPGDIISINRGKAERDTPLIAGGGADAGVDLAKFRRRCPIGITPYLLHLWQWRELTEFFGQEFRPSARTIEVENEAPSLAELRAEHEDEAA